MDGTVELSTEFDDLNDDGTADHDDIDFDLSTPRDQTTVSDLELSSDLQAKGYQRGRIPSIVITEPSSANLENLGNPDHDDENEDLESKTQAVVDEHEANSEIEISNTVQELSENFDDINTACENKPENSTNIENHQELIRDERDEAKDCKQSEETDKHDMVVINDNLEALNDQTSDAVGLKQEEDVTNMITHLHNTEAEKDDDEMAEEVSLDNIMMKDKSDSDSDSEFDFDLPTPTSNNTSSVKPVQQDANVKPVQQDATVKPVQQDATIRPVQQDVAVKPVQIGTPFKINEPEKTLGTEGSHDFVTGAPESQLKNISSQKFGPNTGSSSPQASSIGMQKPVAVIKPTSQPAQAPYVVPPPPDEGTQHMLESAQAEWDKVTTVQAGYKEAEGTVKGAEPTIVQTVEPMTTQELQQLIKQEDFSEVRARIKPVVERHGLSAFVSFLFGPPKLHRDLLDERDRVFCVAASQFNNDNNAHIRTLQTIYRCLTGSKFDCPRIGGHWEEIGFQGIDPATDLRGTGVLGLINLLHILKDGKKHQLACDIYRMSLHPTQNFPFCIMGINLSKIALQVLREGLLNKECNRRHEVFNVVNDFYAGLYLQMYQIWKGQGKTIADSGFVIQDIEMKAKKSPRDVFRRLDEYLNKKTVVIAEKSADTGGDNFVNVCDDRK